MGTEIRVYMEAKYRDNNEWELEAIFNLGRYYDLFSLLAGVRGTHSPIVPPRGLPADIGYELQEIAHASTVDTPSWLAIPEIEQVINKYHDLDLKIVPGLLAIYGALIGYQNSGVKARLVFWFS